jgi:glyoxalase family protein
MRLALVGIDSAENEKGWSNGDVSAEHAIRGFHGITLMLAEAAPTGAILTDVFSFDEVVRDGTLLRHRAGRAGFGNVVDIREAGDFLPGRMRRRTPPHRFRADHDRLEIAITIGWNRRSRCSGMSDHDGLERVITIGWNQ